MPRVASIRLGDLQDLPAILELLDGAIAWLAARGAGGQWGTEPFSTSPAMVDYLSRIIANGELRIAQGGTADVIGGYVLGEHPDYAPAICEPERYIEAMVTDRTLAGHGFGALLVEDAILRARTLDATRLRADCWAGSERLIRWYEEHGFTRDEVLLVGDWPAQMLSMAL